MDVHHTRTEVVLNPDFDAMDAFSNSWIPEGAVLFYLTTPDIRYIWRDGKMVPAEITRSAQSSNSVYRMKRH